MGLTLEELFPGRFLRAIDFKGKPVTLTMKGVELENLPNDKGDETSRGILVFAETKKKLVVNRTNGEAIKAMFGRLCDDWIGKRLTFFPDDRVRFGRETVGGIRIQGSPDISAPVCFDLKLPRKKPIQTRLIPTGKGAAASPPPIEDAPTPPETTESGAP